MRIIRTEAVTLPLAAILLLAFPAGPAWAGARPETPTRPVVVATIFPVYDFTRVVAGDRMEVRMLLPPGVETHAYEPTPRDVVSVSHATALVYVGPSMEPWIEGFVAGVGNPRLAVVDAAAGIELARDESHAPDPHVWLDPTLAERMVGTIADALAAVDPEGASTYRANATAYQINLVNLDRRIAAELEGLPRKTIVYGGHFAFGYFARRYHLAFVSPYRGFSPDSEPTPRAVAELVEVLKSAGSRVVFHEELLESRVARVLAEATGARLELLHGIHNVTRDELDRGVTYLSLMQENLARIREALTEP